MEIDLSSKPEDIRKLFFRLKTVDDVADLLEIQPDYLVYQIFQRPEAELYRIFTIPKKYGGRRSLSAPNAKLKEIQNRLNQVLSVIYFYRTPAASHGFVMKKSIVTNAVLHAERKRKWVFNLDLLDFFPSINFGRVHGMFLKKPYKLTQAVATVLARICCFNNQLPQGAPTSPVISNMICTKLDRELTRLAAIQRSTYTRYADDITFSTSLSQMPPEIVKTNSLGQIVVGNALSTIIRNNGFKINPRKIRLLSQYRRQEVTGLTVNEFPNVNRKYILDLRAMLHNWEKNYEEAELKFQNIYDKKYRGSNDKKPSFGKVVKGKIDFLGMVRGKDDHIYNKYLNNYKKLIGSEESAQVMSDAVKTALPQHDVPLEIDQYEHILLDLKVMDKKLKEKIGNEFYNDEDYYDFSNLSGQLEENIRAARKLGDDPTSSRDRKRIKSQLNRISLKYFKIAFHSLAE